MVQSTTVVIAERESLYRRGLAACLGADERIRIVASVGTARDAFRAASEHQPHLILVGTTLPDRPGLLPVAELRLRHPGGSIIVLAEQVVDRDLIAASSAGAAACLPKDVSEVDLLQTCQRVANNEYLINEQLLAQAAAKRSSPLSRSTIAHGTWSTAGSAPLSGRELEILKRISDGLTNSEIGDALGISLQTVKNHVTSILRKMAVSDRTQAVVLALRSGWIPITEPGPDPTAPPTSPDLWHMLPRQ
jgi:DNA-binding NarL/FixJ family response regulator